MTKEYLSDEELQRLIDEAESAPLLAAPSYLKTEILYKTDRIMAQPVPGSYAPTLPPSWRFVFYSLKVGIASAAAVLMLLCIPMGPGNIPFPGRNSGWRRRIMFSVGLRPLWIENRMNSAGIFQN